jgi:hypothetical protein
MTAETQSRWHGLSLDADLAATRCDYCRLFGHRAGNCPRLEHVVETGVSLQSTEADRKVNLACTVFLFMLGFFAGCCLTKLVETLVR